ncbi:MAG TPA: ABC transporter substrate-binding protein [bacterium]|nr:ABC transporter substrate-binding protein [bacterium]
MQLGVAILWSVLLGGALAGGLLVPASSQPQKRKIIFAMPVAPPNVVHTPVELAKELGYMDKAGIDLDVKDFEGSTRGLTAAIAGGVNIGYINCEEAYGNGVPLVGFYDTAAKLPVMMIARDSIKTIKDLKGKKVGLSSAPGGFIDRMNRAALAAAGLKMEDVTVVPTTTAGRVAALVSGQTDTAVFHYEQVSKVLRTLRGYHVILDMYQALPNYDYHLMCGMRPWVQQHRDAVVDMVAATIRAIRYAYGHRAESVRIFATFTGADVPDVGYAYAKLTTNCIWSRNTGLDMKRLNWYIDYAYSQGDMKTKYRAEDMVDTSIADEALTKAGGPVPVRVGCL